MNNEFVKWEDAKIHILTHALHYGSGVFEGIRCYNTEKGPAIFRLKEHVDRLFNSAGIYMMNIPYSNEKINDVIKETVTKNGVKECYIRPIVYYGYGEMGLNPKTTPVDVAVAIWPWGTYLGEEGLKNGIRCKISSWARIDNRILPTQAKACGHYLNSILAKREAINSGYDEAILLNLDGKVVEGPGENLFIVKNGTIITSPVSIGALDGITRKSLITVSEDMGLRVNIREFTKDELYNADEAFLTGTAAEVTPVREVDDNTIGTGTRGPITEKIQNKFFDIVKGNDLKYSDWLTYL